MAAITTYTVTLTHPDLSEPLVAEVPASSPERAILRLRHHAMHRFHAAELLTEGEATAEPVQLCEWFSACGEPATETVRHPGPRGYVSTCARCARLATA